MRLLFPPSPRLTEAYSLDMLKADRTEGFSILLILRKSGKLAFANRKADLKAEPDDVVLSFGKPTEAAAEQNGA